MDLSKYFDITHRDHVICNPISEEKLNHLVELLRLPYRAQVVDIACGKGEFLIRLSEAYTIRGLGIDNSPFYISEAEKRLQTRAPDAEITFTQMGGAEFKPDELHSFDLVSCIGASWIFGGHAETLKRLISFVKPGGWVVVGEPYWLKEPVKEYLKSSGMVKEDLGTHFSNADTGRQLGLNLLHTFVSSRDDWDRYEGCQWLATTAYARNHPDDPDLVELIQRIEKSQSNYLRWGRDTIGWAIYVFRKP